MLKRKVALHLWSSGWFKPLAFLIILETCCWYFFIWIWWFLEYFAVARPLGREMVLGLTRNCYGPPLQNPNAQWFILGGCKVQSSTIEIWANSPNFRWFSFTDEMTRHEAKKGFPPNLLEFHHDLRLFHALWNVSQVFFGRRFWCLHLFCFIRGRLGNEWNREEFLGCLLLDGDLQAFWVPTSFLTLCIA